MCIRDSYQIKKIVGSYIAAMGGVDAIVFTGGIGETDKDVRLAVCTDMEFMGVKIEPAKNDFRGEERCISTPDSKVQVLSLIHICADRRRHPLAAAVR